MYEVLKIKQALKMGINPNNVLRLLGKSLEGLHFPESEINDAEVQLKERLWRIIMQTIENGFIDNEDIV